jgi:DNA-binding NtrC family response regulator
MERSKGTVLIVDDDEPIGIILSFRLEKEGYTCESANRGDEALYKAFMKDFDIILLDINMPGMSGIEVLNKMLVDHPDSAVMMLTGVDDTNTAVDALKKGAYDYVLKPFNMEDLSIRVSRALERKKLTLENREHELRLDQKVREQAAQITEFSEEALKGVKDKRLIDTQD